MTGDHLTQALDAWGRPSYSATHLAAEPDARPDAGGAPSWADNAEPGWAAESRLRQPPRRAHLARGPRSRSRGPLAFSHGLRPERRPFDSGGQPLHGCARRHPAAPRGANAPELLRLEDASEALREGREQSAREEDP